MKILSNFIIFTVVAIIIIMTSSCEKNETSKNVVTKNHTTNVLINVPEEIRVGISALINVDTVINWANPSLLDNRYFFFGNNIFPDTINIFYVKNGVIQKKLIIKYENDEYYSIKDGREIPKIFLKNRYLFETDPFIMIYNNNIYYLDSLENFFYNVVIHSGFEELSSYKKNFSKMIMLFSCKERHSNKREELIEKSFRYDSTNYMIYLSRGDELVKKIDENGLFDFLVQQLRKREISISEQWGLVKKLKMINTLEILKIKYFSGLINI